jgi:acetylornithine deacetylase/succinyl-diaminopimelate desuccinylase-like protein
MVDLDSLLMQVDQSTSELLGLHKELVKIESVNTGQMPTGNESNVADLAKQWLSNEGIESEVVESAPGRGNLIAKEQIASGITLGCCAGGRCW